MWNLHMEWHMQKPRAQTLQGGLKVKHSDPHPKLPDSQPSSLGSGAKLLQLTQEDGTWRLPPDRLSGACGSVRNLRLCASSAE
ncbi:hypothetical protein GCM10017674_66160 [Streptomyces gardneri]|nr:hypothetical protein GCM10017674_66160 [Streptomyces gardneri]